MNIPKIIVPEYMTTVPSTSKQIKFRPFLVKENKILLLAEESKNTDIIYNAIIQILNNCTNNTLNINELSALDIQYIFFKIRAKSMGEKSRFNVPCKSCEAKNELEIDFDNIELKTIPGHNKKVILGDSMGVVFKYPTLNTEKILLQENLSDSEKEIKLICSCIDYFYSKEDLYYSKDLEESQLVEFIENLTIDNYNKVKHFFETMPKLSYEIDYECVKCKAKDRIIIEHLRDFFM